MGIESLLNYTADILRLVEDADSPVTNDAWNHPEEDILSPAVLATVACAVQERSMTEQASLTLEGAVRSTHKVYMVQPPANSSGPVVVDERARLHIVELGLDLDVVGVRDGGGRGHHLEIDAIERVP